MERAKALFGKAAFVMGRGYDDNKMFLKLDSMEQEYVVRLAAKRKLLWHNKWAYAAELRNRRKGKVKLPLFYKGKVHDAYLSHIKVQITASRKDIYPVLVYGITEHTMMLAANREIKSKDDVIKTAKLYFSRRKIEEYFRCKKQMSQFENFRVRKLEAINALNFYLTLCMAFLGHISMKPETNALKAAINTDCRSGQRKNSILLLQAGKRYLWHTFVCKRRHQALVPDKAPCIPSTLP